MRIIGMCQDFYTCPYICYDEKKEPSKTCHDKGCCTLFLAPGSFQHTAARAAEVSQMWLLHVRFLNTVGINEAKSDFNTGSGLHYRSAEHAVQCESRNCKHTHFFNVQIILTLLPTSWLKTLDQ